MNSWYVESLYDFQYFVCPSCDFKNISKQEFVTHALETHAEPFLKNCVPCVRDESLNDVNFNIVEKNDYENHDIEKFGDFTEGEKESFKILVNNEEKHTFDEVNKENSDDQAPVFKDYGSTIIISTANDDQENVEEDNQGYLYQ